MTKKTQYYIALACEMLSATLDAKTSTYIYYANETNRYYRVGYTDMVNLGERLESDEVDVYSFWCNDAELLELPEGWEIDSHLTGMIRSGKTLLDVADGIITSDYCDQTLATLYEIQQYAENGMGLFLNDKQAMTIQCVAKSYCARLKAGEISGSNDRYYQYELPLSEEIMTTT